MVHGVDWKLLFFGFSSVVGLAKGRFFVSMLLSVQLSLAGCWVDLPLVPPLPLRGLLDRRGFVASPRSVLNNT